MRKFLTESWTVCRGNGKVDFLKKGSRSFHVSKSLRSSPFIVSSDRPSITNTADGLSVPELVWSNLHLKENRIALECSLTGQKLTYSDIYKQSRSFAAALIRAGLKQGEVVSVILPNVLEFPTILLGVLDAGGIMSPANPAYTSDEIVRQVALSEAKFAITIPALLPAVREAEKHCSSLQSIILVGEAHEGCHTFSEMIKVDPAGSNFLKGSQINTRDTVAMLPFSSGTTGPPKGVQLTHYNICANARQYLTENCAGIRNVDHGHEPDRLIGVLPFFHCFGFMASIVAGFYTGNHTLCIQKFGSDTFLGNLRQIQANVLTLVPPIIAFLIHHPGITSKDFETVRCIQSGAAPLGPALISKLLEKAGKDIFIQNMYGLTETSPAALVLNPKFGNSKIGSCGSALPDTFVKVVDIESGNPVGPNQKGEICIQGPQNMKGYFNNEKATREMIKEGNWLHTGDVAYYDEDKCFYVVDRIKELIKVKGFQVAPAELEDHLRKHPEVADVAVIGIPDVKFGEIPRAYVVRKTENLSETQVQEFLTGKVAEYKELRGGVEFLDAIPKAPSGKILRRELKQSYLQQTL